MKITVRQLKRLIREAVEDASGEQLYDPTLGLEDVTNSREKQNGTVALLDPQTGDKYKILRQSRYVRLYQTEWEVMAGKRGNMASQYNRQQPLMIVSPKDVADDAEFVEYAYERITQYVNKRRTTLPARKKERQFWNDRDAASTARQMKYSTELTPEEQELETNKRDFKGPFTGKNIYRSPEFRARDEAFVNYWKDKPRPAWHQKRSVD